jgi:chemotaxis protein MotB
VADTLQPIVIKKKKAHHAHHGGAWKVAYADFVTAMMALFIVLWLLSSSEQTKKAIGGYFQDPEGAGKQMGSGMAGLGDAIQVSKTDMSQLKEKLESAVKNAPALKAIKEQVKITTTGEGLRIELLETAAGTFFGSGSSKPSDECFSILKLMAAELAKLPNPVVIEGHTDSKPFGAPDYSNWELSGDRANAARRIMQREGGLRSNQVAQVRGFADQQPFKKDDPEHPSNRRITVIVQSQVAPDRAPGKEEKPKEGGHH